MCTGYIDLNKICGVKEENPVPKGLMLTDEECKMLTNALIRYNKEKEKIDG